MKQLYKQNKDTQHDTHEKREKTINIIKEKLMINKAIISKADKGNSIIITYQDEYHKKS
jgi:hypothetical protein